MTVKEPPYPIISRTENSCVSKIILILGMVADSFKYVIVPNINLSGERMLDMNLRKSIRNYGKLKIYKFSSFELHQVISLLESIT